MIFDISRAIIRETPEILSVTESLSASTVKILVAAEDRFLKKRAKS